MALYQMDDAAPTIAASAFVAESATVIGRVTLGEHATVWPGAVLRADDATITIGEHSNVQDNAVLHVDPGVPLSIGAGVTIGHLAMLHGCTVGDGSLIGLGAIVLNRAVIGRECLVGAGALVTEGKVFPDRSLIVGTPAKVIRQLSDQDVAGLRRNAQTYAERGERYRTRLKRIG